MVVSIEGTRSYGDRPGPGDRCRRSDGDRVRTAPAARPAAGRGKSDPIDAHLAVLAALRLDVDRLPAPRADGDREALRILLGTRHELTMVTAPPRPTGCARCCSAVRTPSEIWPARPSPTRG